MDRALILIIDDNPSNLKLAKTLLESEGHHVLTATDAEQALHALEAFLPHLILMDIQLPGMDGLTLTERVKSGAQTRDIPVVAMTAYAMKGDEARALAAGCQGYITKPINTRHFVADVMAYVPAAAYEPAGGGDGLG